MFAPHARLLCFFTSQEDPWRIEAHRKPGDRKDRFRHFARWVRKETMNYVGGIPGCSSQLKCGLL